MGASGFLGSALYKELHKFYDTYGTYCTGKIASDNAHFLRYDMIEDDLYPILQKVKPTIIISSLRGDFDAQVDAHETLLYYALKTNAFILFVSSSNVFDAFTNYPSYEFDKTLSESKYGKFKIRCENFYLRNLPETQYAICRLPMVFGLNSPRVREIKSHLLLGEPIEVFPHLIINATTDKKLSQQIHYIINRKRSGIFHLGSTDLIHHQELINEVVIRLDMGIKPHLKRVYTSNYDRYLAVLPRDNKLPLHLNITNEEVVTESRVF